MDPGWVGYGCTTQQRVVCGESVYLVGIASILTIGAMHHSNVATMANEMLVEEGYVEVNEKFN